MSPRARRWILPMLLLLLGGSLAVNLILIRTLRRQYEFQLIQQIWPAGAMPQPSEYRHGETNSHLVLLLGDSRIAEWKDPNLGPWRVVNAGAGGQTTAQVRLRVDTLLQTLHPNVVVVQAGINDLKLLGIRPEWSDLVVSQAESNLAAIVQSCIDRQAQVILLETWPTARPSLTRRLFWNDAIPRSVEALNAKLRQLDSPIRGIHARDLIAEAAIRPETDYRDTLHLKPGVYPRLDAALLEELNRLPTDTP